MFGFSTRWLNGGALLCIALLAGCGAPKLPTAADMVGLSPAGQIEFTQNIANGEIKGVGKLSYQGVPYRFSLAGKVLVPPNATANFVAAGTVYNMDRISDVVGRYSQITAQSGPNGPNPNELWMRNQDHTIIRLFSNDAAALKAFSQAEVYLPQVE